MDLSQPPTYRDPEVLRAAAHELYCRLLAASSSTGPTSTSCSRSAQTPRRCLRERLEGTAATAAEKVKIFGQVEKIAAELLQHSQKEF
jgi:hypothetical protein